jgi:hypothetical protein
VCIIVERTTPRAAGMLVWQYQPYHTSMPALMQVSIPMRQKSFVSALANQPPLLKA